MPERFKLEVKMININLARPKIIVNKINPARNWIETIVMCRGWTGEVRISKDPVEDVPLVMILKTP